MVNTIGQPLEESIAFQYFIFGGVLDRNPDLRSDYPFDMGDTDPLGSLNACTALSAEQREMIAGGNARTLFRIG